MKTGIELIADERYRQIYKEGWSSYHDAKHTNGELAQAAMCYANPIPSEGFITAFWPFDRLWYKRSSSDPIKNLVKAGALIAAEIDRIQRLENENDKK